MEVITLTPGSVTLAELRAIWKGAPIRLADTGWAAIDAAAGRVGEILASGRTVYGVNTGFGLLAQTRIPDNRLEELQRNLILSHCAGIGDPLDRRLVRLMLVLKVIGLGRGKQLCAKRDLSLAKHRGAEMCQWRQVSRSADRALRRDHRKRTGIEQGEQPFDDDAPDAAMTTA